jgi:hypothetical protein
MKNTLKDLDEFVRRELGELRNDSRTTALDLKNTKVELDELKKQVVQLQKDVENLRSKTSITQSTYPPYQTGRIRLVNTFSEPETIVLNRRSYRLAPGQEEILDNQPAGAFTFEVLGVQAAVSRTLVANETYTIQVYPR